MIDWSDDSLAGDGVLYNTVAMEYTAPLPIDSYDSSHGRHDGATGLVGSLNMSHFPNGDTLSASFSTDS